MKIFVQVLSVLLLNGFGAGNVSMLNPVVQSAKVLTFSGTTPIAAGLNLPVTVTANDFESMKWRLTLMYNIDGKQPATYSLVRLLYAKNDGRSISALAVKTIEERGIWTIKRGTKSNAAAVVYKLQTDKKDAELEFVRINEHLLHLVDTDGRLVIGNPGWSYTLNRTNADD
jgi:hypothetical protein